MVKHLSQQKRVLLTSTFTCFVHSENLITSLAFLTASATERSREELKQKMAGFLSEGPACQKEKISPLVSTKSCNFELYLGFSGLSLSCTIRDHLLQPYHPYLQELRMTFWE